MIESNDGWEVHKVRGLYGLLQVTNHDLESLELLKCQTEFVKRHWESFQAVGWNELLRWSHIIIAGLCGSEEQSGGTE